MSSLIFDTQDWIRRPRSLESFGRFAMETLGKENFDLFLCFLNTEDSLFLHPDPGEQRIRAMVSELITLNWVDRPRPSLERILVVSGKVSEEELRARLSWRLIAPGEAAAPIGAVAYLLRPGVEDPFATHGRVIDAFAEEVLSCRGLVEEFSRIARDSDYLFSTINRIGSLLLQRSSRPQLLAALLDLAIYLSRCEVGTILVRDEQGALSSEMELGFDPELAASIRMLPRDESLLEMLERVQKAVVVDDGSGPTLRIPDSHPVSIQCLIAIPIFSAQRLVGAICLASGEAGKEVSTNEIRSLETLASVIALAIENEFLQEKLEGRTESGSGSGAPEPAWIQRLLEVVPVAVVMGTERGELLHQNQPALELLTTGKASGVTAGFANPVARTWLRAHWRGRESGRIRVRPPFKSVRGLELELSTRELRLRVGRELRTYLISSIEEVSPEGLHSPAVPAPALRSSLGKIRLGVDLLTRWATRLDGEAEVDRFNASRRALLRSITSLERQCEDVEGVWMGSGDDRPEAIELCESFRKALDLYRSEQPLRKWQEPDGWPRGWTVFTNPERFRSSLLKVLVSVCSLAVIQRAVRLSVEARQDLGVIGFDFESTQPDAQEELLAFLEARETTPSGSRFPGLKSALEHFREFGGSLVGAGHPGGFFHLELAIPVETLEGASEEESGRGSREDLETTP